MNEITRIHLAKTPYNIETQAHSALRAYLDAIEKALHADTDAMREIESRMSEILTERGVKGDIVITAADVEALQKQLGDPKDFAGDDAEGAAPAASAPKKRLMRDTSNAMLGGVCSGIAAYFGWDVVWVRVIAVLLVFITSGVMIPLYIVLLVVMPEAKTAADRLEMAGSAVTLGALKQSAATAVERVEPVLVKVLRALFGAMLVAGAAVSFIAAAVAAAYILIRPGMLDYFGSRLEMGVSVGLMALGGVMLAAFCGILAYMVFQKKTERNLVIALILATVLGLGSFGAGIAMPITRQVTMQGKLAVTNTTKHLSADLQGVTAIKVASSNLDVRYTVSDTRHEARLRYNDFIVKKPNVSLTRQGATLVVDGTFTKGSACVNVFAVCDNKPLQLYITGPALEAITAAQGDVVYEATSQDLLSVEHSGEAAVGVTSKGRIGTLSVKGTGGSFGAIAATIGVVNLEAARSSNTFASVDALNITTQTGSCSEPVTIIANHAGTVQVNGQDWQSSAAYPCLAIMVSDRG